MSLVLLATVLCMPTKSKFFDYSSISSPHQPPSSSLRSPEERINVWQWMSVSWMGPLMARGSTRQLEEKDVWALPFDFQHERLHSLFRELKGTVVGRLLQANAPDLFIITVLGTLETVIELSTIVLFKQFLASISRENPSRRAAMVYTIMVAILRLVKTQSGVFSLWFCRRCYERSRGEMITMIYEKTLTRKAFTFPSEHKDEQETRNTENEANGANGHGPQNGLESKPSRSYWSKVKQFLPFGNNKSKGQRETVGGISALPNTHMSNLPASAGKILNLMRNDVYEVAQRFWEFPSILTKPLNVVLSVVLVWRILGPACLLGLLFVILSQLVNWGFVKLNLRWERVRRSVTDTKLQVVSQYVEAIRHLRWYDWQSKWLQQILQARHRELNLRVLTYMITSAIRTINLGATYLFPVAAFYAYTAIEGRPLRIEIAFPALALFDMLSTSLAELPDLVTVLLNAHIAVGRIEEFMSEPDKESHGPAIGPQDLSLEIHDASYSWPGRDKTVLEHINLTFPVGVTVVCGKVGQGKTALLQAILGELDHRSGESWVPEEDVGYCAQTPWLQSMSIRENILFSSEYDERRYKQVLEACCLLPDLASFKSGDLSNIGENGVGLSGGQKARVALARAVYSQARILLLDDPIAALDHNTAETIVQKLLRGPLSNGRLIVFVTHRVDLVNPFASQVVEISDGHATILDLEELAGNEVLLKRITSTDEPVELDSDSKDQEDAAVPDKFMEDEHRATGGVMASVYWDYVKAGKLRWWAVIFIAFAFYRIMRLGGFWYLKVWGEAYERGAPSLMIQLTGMKSAQEGPVSNPDASPTSNGLNRFFDRFPSPDDNIMPWLVGFLVLSLIQVIAYGISGALMIVPMYVSGKTLFHRIMHRVSNATFRFYDVTPVGRLMNRLTSDMGTLDGAVINQLQLFVWYMFAWLTAIAVIAASTPVFLAFALVLTGAFIYVFLRFLPTSQSLRRLEMVSLSPLMSNFGTLLEGLSTVRAFRAQSHFQQRNIATVDEFQKMDHFYWSLQTWLMYRFDALSALATFLLTLLALYQRLSPGLTAFVLTAASNFVLSTHGLCKCYGQLQMDFVSVERVIELLSIEQEPEGDIKPPASWPSYADDIIFKNVSVRYAANLEPSLEDISLRIPGGSTVAVVGRTGSGKSTLALSLLATVRPEPGGSICIGSMDVSKVDVHALRQRISFVAQDPVLFPGTLRQNLDPLGDHTDDECSEVLQKVLGNEFTLGSHIDGGGKNLSQGQRQLVGLGRAALRRSPIVILDEASIFAYRVRKKYVLTLKQATASIDKKTAMDIQQILRDELKQSTVVTIAHRVEAVKDADFCIVLDKGKVAASGPPAEVLKSGWDQGAATA
ncbi:ATPase-like protein [Eremomyces bilateralis CBS 781.70]|uniref:ATPase-like protein n=1 Tax=Eremomyces bilateralis CBS 781.70 TaxID=1392243 RepID=A0A6G1FRB9_9PEZI|nr:ATPase-like protein [Eremomyces bilateralis CBS 781.70]KAF1808278.1 ATPase-like protein [Eremomyces bilateralis CBS 781.70]